MQEQPSYPDDSVLLTGTLNTQEKTLSDAFPAVGAELLLSILPGYYEDGAPEDIVKWGRRIGLDDVVDEDEDEDADDS